MLTDRRLLKQLRTGDLTALREVYIAYKDDLLTTAVCLLNDVAEAEDCLHDVFVSFAGKVMGLRIRGSLKAYLAASVANRARDRLRSRRREPITGTDLPDLGGSTENPLREMVDSEESMRIVLVLAELPCEQREVIVLHVKNDMTFRSIARMLNVPANTVRSRYRYGIDKLRKLLAEREKQ
jgi:RNA polymerase sigma factor (sigma-70 family)